LFQQTVARLFINSVNLQTTTNRRYTMTITPMKRIFEFQGIRLPDPNSAMTVEQVRGVFATQYPEIATAALTGPETVGDKCVYRFERAIGTKG
jgi:PRTRC genetic system protein C